jgi:hypothetical protein
MSCLSQKVINRFLYISSICATPILLLLMTFPNDPTNLEDDLNKTPSFRHLRPYKDSWCDDESFIGGFGFRPRSTESQIPRRVTSEPTSSHVSRTGPRSTTKLDPRSTAFTSQRSLAYDGTFLRPSASTSNVPDASLETSTPIPISLPRVRNGQNRHRSSRRNTSHSFTPTSGLHQMRLPTFQLTPGSTPDRRWLGAPVIASARATSMQPGLSDGQIGYGIRHLRHSSLQYPSHQASPQPRSQISQAASNYRYRPLPFSIGYLPSSVSGGAVTPPATPTHQAVSDESPSSPQPQTKQEFTGWVEKRDIWRKQHIRTTLSQVANPTRQAVADEFLNSSQVKKKKGFLRWMETKSQQKTASQHHFVSGRNSDLSSSCR